MEKFCKIFESEEYGQILVIKDTNEKHQPQVSVKFIPQGLGVCGPDFAFSDEDEDLAWEKVDKLFDSLEFEQVESLAEETTHMALGFVN